MVQDYNSWLGAIADIFYPSLEKVENIFSIIQGETTNFASLLDQRGQYHIHRGSRLLRLQPLTIAKTRSLQFSLRFNSPSLLFPEPAAGPAFTVCFVHTLRRQPIYSPTSSQRRSYAKRKMPPKKAVKEEKILLGRPGNNLKSGIVCTGPGLAVL